MNEEILEQLIVEVKKLSEDVAVIKDALISSRSTSTVDFEPDFFEQCESSISKLLRKLGIFVNLSGFRYLKEAIKLILKDESYLNALVNKLYPAVAEKCNSSTMRVERAIRHAVERAWENNRQNDLWKQLFLSSNRCPTNSQFLACLLEFIKQSPH